MQTALTKLGFFNGPITGYFGPLTHVSLAAWQRSNGDPEIAYFGALGRARMNSIFGCSSANRPPSISGVSGPTVLNVNQSGSWSVTASDPENGSLSYSVIWGDESGAVAGSSAGVQQTASFTHAYARAGSFTPTFTVTDNAGQSVHSSLGVVVVGVIQVPQLPILEFISSDVQIDNDPNKSDVAVGRIVFEATAVGGSLFPPNDNDIKVYAQKGGEDSLLPVLSKGVSYTPYVAVTPAGTKYRIEVNATFVPVVSGNYRFLISKINWSYLGNESPIILFQNTGLGNLKTSFVSLHANTQPIPTPTITSSYPPNGAIDARDPSGELEFAEVGFYSGASIPNGYIFSVSDFSVSSTLNNLPININYIEVSGSVLDPSIIPILNRRIVPQERITITHKPSNLSVCVGRLPGDVNGDGRVLSSDVSMMNGVLASTQIRPSYSTDIDRSGRTDQADLTRLNEIMTAPGLIRILPPCPPVTVSTRINQIQMANTLSSLQSLLQTLKSLAR